MLTHGREQQWDLVGAVLSVAVEDDHDVGAQLARGAEAGGQRLPLALVHTMLDQTGAGCSGDEGRGVARAVVDDDDLVDILTRAQDDAADAALFIVGGDEGDDARARVRRDEHGAIVIVAQ